MHDGPLGGSAKWARSFDDKAVADHNVPFHDGPKGGSAKRARSFDDKAVADHNVPFPPKASASVRDAMRTEAVEAGWISPEPEPPPRIVVINSCTGEKMLNVTPDDIDWPAGMGFYEMVIADLRDMCGISHYDGAFWDVIHGSKVCEHLEGVIWHGAIVYSLYKRSCPRCTQCSKECTRKGSRVLCAHGDARHLWHVPKQDDFHGCKRIHVSVQGYNSFCGIWRSGLSDEEIEEEVTRITREFATDEIDEGACGSNSSRAV